MPKKAQMVGQIITIGNSIGITLDKKVQRALGLEKGDLVQLTIEKFEEEDKS